MRKSQSKHLPWFAATILCAILAPARMMPVVADATPEEQAANLSGVAVLQVNAPADPAAARREIATHVALLSDDATLARVLAKPDSATRKTAWFKKCESAAVALERLSWNRHVAQVPDTNLIEVRLPFDAAPAERKVIIEEIIDAYIEAARKRDSDQSNDASKSVRDLRTRYELHRREVNQAMREKAIILSAEGGGPDRVGLKEQEQTHCLAALDRAREQLAHDQSRRDAIAAVVKAGKEPPEVDEQVAQDWRVRSLERQLDEIEIGRAVPALLPEHPDSKAKLDALAATAKAVTARLDEAKADVRSRARASLLGALDERVSQGGADVRRLSGALESLKQDLGELTNKHSDYLVLADEERSLRQEINNLDKQLTVRDSQTRANYATGRIEWVRMPQVLP